MNKKAEAQTAEIKLQYEQLRKEFGDVMDQAGTKNKKTPHESRMLWSILPSWEKDLKQAINFVRDSEVLM